MDGTRGNKNVARYDAGRVGTNSKREHRTKDGSEDDVWKPQNYRENRCDNEEE